MRRIWRRRFWRDLARSTAGTRLAAQELEGLLLEGDGALWRVEDLKRARSSMGARPEKEELLALGASESEGLLDRADALVWALSALMEGPQREGPRLRVLGGDARRLGLSRP